MRIALTLDAATEGAVRRLMAEPDVSFTRALTEAIRAGAPPRQVREFHTRSRRLGAPAVDPDRALTVAGDLEDEDLLRRLRSGERRRQPGEL